MTIENINKMVTLSLQKKNILEQILDLTIEQSQLIKDDKLDEMEYLLQSKQKKMDEVDELDINFLELYNEVKKTERIESISHIDINKYSNLKDLKNEVDSINIILYKISKLDKENTDEMRRSLKIVQQSIKDVKNGKRAYKGYNKNQIGSILIDEKK